MKDWREHTCPFYSLVQWRKAFDVGLPSDSRTWTVRVRELDARVRRILKHPVLHSKRQHKRVETPQGMWVVWQCGRTEDTSRVKDLSVGGLFVETLRVCPVDATVELHFLVEEGEISAKATVRYVKAGSGLGLKFKAVRGEDQARFATMIKRLLMRG